MKHCKIETIDENKVVNCHYFDCRINVHKCEKCRRFIKIDPVKSEIQCRRD